MDDTDYVHCASFLSEIDRATVQDPHYSVRSVSQCVLPSEAWSCDLTLKMSKHTYTAIPTGFPYVANHNHTFRRGADRAGPDPDREFG